MQNIYHNTKIGNDCKIDSGTVIGSDGFGLIKKNNLNLSIPHIGNVSIGNNTFIGSGVIIKNNVKIGSNVIIGASVYVDKDIEDNKILKKWTKI